METQEYNGWTNRETWATMLHIDNDEVLLETALDYARTALEEHRNDDPTDPQAGESFALYCLQDTVKTWIEDDLLTLENISGNHGLWLMLTDIGSLYRVNWREIAESLLQNAKENVNA